MNWLKRLFSDESDHPHIFIAFHDDGRIRTVNNDTTCNMLWNTNDKGEVVITLGKRDDRNENRIAIARDTASEKNSGQAGRIKS